MTFTEESPEEPCESLIACSNVVVWQLLYRKTCGCPKPRLFCDPCKVIIDTRELWRKDDLSCYLCRADTEFLCWKPYRKGSQ